MSNCSKYRSAKSSQQRKKQNCDPIFNGLYIQRAIDIPSKAFSP